MGYEPPIEQEKEETGDSTVATTQKKKRAHPRFCATAIC